MVEFIGLIGLRIFTLRKLSRTWAWFFCVYSVDDQAIVQFGLVPAWAFIGMSAVFFASLDFTVDLGALADAVVGVGVAYLVAYGFADLGRKRLEHADSEERSKRLPTREIGWASIRGIEERAGQVLVFQDSDVHRINVVSSELLDIEAMARAKNVPVLSSRPSAVFVKTLRFISNYSIVFMLGLVFLIDYPAVEIVAAFAILAASVISTVSLAKVGVKPDRVQMLLASVLGGALAWGAVTVFLLPFLPLLIILSAATVIGAFAGAGVYFLGRP